MESRTYEAKRKNWRELPREKWWVEGAIFEGKENSYIITNVKVTDEWEDSEIGADVIGYLVDPETICQDTGLTDKDGRKIFDGDIVRYTDEVIGKEKVDEIKYNETHAAFCRIHKSEMGLQYLFTDESIANRCEVIGNIYDNPALVGVT